MLLKIVEIDVCFRSSLQNITLIANGAECHPAVVNGNLVALCTRKSVYNDVTIYRCHGWGGFCYKTLFS